MTKNLKWYEKISYYIVTSIEQFYYNLGYKVASHPIKTIGICWIVVAISALGYLRFYQEKNPLKLWVPRHSEFLKDTNWLMSKFQNGLRMERVLIEALDVLTPGVLGELVDIDKRIKNIVTTEGIAWPDVCFKIPDVQLDMMRMLNSNSNKTNGDYDPSVSMSTVLYCNFVESFDQTCFQNSILQFWNYNEKKIKQTTKEEILNKLDKYKSDPILGELRNFEQLLGGIQRNETGHIIAASALKSFYAVYINFSAVDMNKVGNIAGTADWASEEVLLWENDFNKVLEEARHNVENFSIYYAAERSFGDLTAASMFQDIYILVIGCILMVIYVQFIISKFNCVEAKIALACIGLLSVGMAFVTACGFCFIIGIPYGPVHTSLPFLLMGLGVDDMFVICSCWEELSRKEKLPLEEQVGHMLKHAGVSITVTSFTDVVAFLIGASTILPSLESFCLYAAMGVAMTFIFVVTFFVACFTLDQQRIMQNRNGALFCYVHKNYKPNKCSQNNWSNKILNYLYSKIIFTLPGKITVLLITIICMGVSIESALKLEQRFSPTWMIPKDTFLSTFIDKSMEYFPYVGFEGGIYLGSLNYSQELKNIHTIVENLENSTDILSNVQSWVDPFQKYVSRNFKKDIYDDVLTTNEFNLFLSKFLFSPKGARYQANFRFTSDLQCGVPVTNITMSSINIQLRHFDGPESYIPAMHRLTNIAKENNFTTGDKFGTAWSKIFATWVTDELIDIEVMRNLQLALLCVMLCTILLVANFQACFWIFVCVLLTMINVCGFMQKWGVTIDMVSCIGLELGIGLCVDYATHIGHTFLTIQEGSREERSLKTVTTIGSAVLYGGISTFIGVSMLGFTKAYTFHVFFKIFFLVIFFGLFHGLLFMPVILSWIGPQPYRFHQPITKTDILMMEET